MAPTPPEVPHLAGRDGALRELGYRDWEAAWLTLVCLHSGVFTRPQFTAHHSVTVEAARKFVGRLVDAGVAREHPVPGMDNHLRYTHVFGRGLYRALGIEHVRHRRKAEDLVLFRRLLSLDHVVRHPGLPWLATEQEKVDHFTGRGIRRSDLPSRVYGRPGKRTRRYFALKLPIAADQESATFVYVDPGRETDTELQRWAKEHRPLWSRLRELKTELHVAVVARTVAAQHQLSSKVAAWLTVPSSPGEPLTPEEYETLAAADRDLDAALATGDPRPLERWGGLNPCRRLVIQLRKRADLEASEAGTRALIDGYSTHHARHLAPQSLA